VAGGEVLAVGRQISSSRAALSNAAFSSYKNWVFWALTGGRFSTIRATLSAGVS
jgi:hypothetical protein